MATICKSTNSFMRMRMIAAPRAASIRPRASSDDSPKTSGSTVFYGGNTYTEDQWNKAVENGTAYVEAAQPNLNGSRMRPAGEADGSISTGPASITDIMAFSGSAPEITNGRLAMLGFVSAVAAELSTGEGVLRQWADEPTLISLTFILFIAASMVPLLGTKPADQQLGPFTRSAELLNGRAAMIGFAALIIVEAVKGSALF